MLAQIRHRIALLLALAVLAAGVPLAGASVSAAELSPAGVISGNLRAVTFVNATTGFAAADNGVIVKTTDGGESWTVVRSADSYSFRGIDFWDANNLVAVDYEGKVAYSTNGGSAWANVDFTPNPDMDPQDTFLTHNDVAAKRGTSEALVAAGDDAPGDSVWIGGTSMRTISALAYWQLPLESTKPHRYYNAGSETWQDVGKGEFLDVEYVTGTTTVWASGIDYWVLDTDNPEKYPLFKSTDEGVTWQKVTGFGTADLRLEGVAFGSATAGITVGQLVGGNRVAYRTTNGGSTWSPATTLPGTAVLNAVDMSSATQGWAVSGDGGIIRTTDGGATWSACTITGGNTAALYDVTFIPGTTTGWAVGAAGTLLITTDGTTWRRPNTAPVALPDSYTVTEDTLRSVPPAGVLANDTDSDGNPLSAVKVTNPSHGTLSLASDGSFTYMPYPNYSGTDSFTYKAYDGIAYSNTVAVTLTVMPVNDAPVAAADAYSTLEDTPLTVAAAAGVLANDTDADGDVLTAVKVDDPAHGAVILNADGSFTYTPTTGYSGTDSFTYKAYDGTAYSAVTTVSVSIGAVNHAPVATPDAYSTDEDTPLVLAAPGVLANDTDTDGDPLTAVKVTDPARGTVTLNANGSFTYTPQPNYYGTDVFTYKASDGVNYSNIVSVSIAVGSVNDAPVATPDTYSTDEDTPLVLAAPGVLANDTDTDGDPLTAVKVNDPAHGTVTLNANGSFTYTPQPNYSGEDSFSYRAYDGKAHSAPVTVGITIRPVNDAPVAVADAYSTPLNTAKTVAAPGVLANDTDADGSALTAVKVTGPAHGTLLLAENGGFTYTPATGYSGVDSFTYKAYDGIAYSNTVTVAITVGSGVPVLAPVYRFYNFTNNTHFFTPSADERDMVMARWSNVFRYEGVAYYTNPANNTQPLTRLYNKVSGSHFYTASPAEAADALAKWPTVFSLDGLTYAVNPAPVANSVPVYRFFNKKNGSHFYTASEDEKNTVIAKYPTVYSYEGPAFWLGQ